MTRAVRILCVVGARPNFTKIAPIMHVFNDGSRPLQAMLLHTGQHYDEAMKASFFDQLDIPEPDVDLEVGSAGHARQTAEIMQRFEPHLDAANPHAVLVVGDVNSTIACALVAVKKHIPVIHVEAGLRSYDRAMPEEINRILTDQISDLLFTTEKKAQDNLVREGIDPGRIHFCGNVMIDTLRANLCKATPPEETLSRAGAIGAEAVQQGYGLVTMHRPSNVDERPVLERLLVTLGDISRELPLVFPIHPRTRARINAFGLDGLLLQTRILQFGPLGYLELLGLMEKARLVLSDSGGIQEETTALGVPCITLRENTERPITVEQGTNTVVGSDAAAITQCTRDILETGGKSGRVPELWDGMAAHRIADVIVQTFNARMPV